MVNNLTDATKKACCIEADLENIASTRIEDKSPIQTRIGFELSGRSWSILENIKIIEARELSGEKNLWSTRNRLQAALGALVLADYHRALHLKSIEDAQSDQHCSHAAAIADQNPEDITQ